MFGLLSIIAIGFFLGMRHATDPDHVVAVTTIVSRQGSARRAALTGAFWGLGHTITILAVGSAIILFDIVIPARLGLAMELCVGFMLIVLGVWNLVSFTRDLPGRESFRRTNASHQVDSPLVHSHPVHSHPHGHGDHAHNPLDRLDRRFGKTSLYQWLRPLMVGVVHGLAGSAAVALLILATIRNSTWAVVYLLVFGVGTIAGMMLITMSIASAFNLVGNRFQALGHRLALISGFVSLAFGLVLAYQICVVHGFFSSNPHWTPH